MTSPNKAALADALAHLGHRDEAHREELRQGYTRLPLRRLIGIAAARIVDCRDEHGEPEWVRGTQPHQETARESTTE